MKRCAFLYEDGSRCMMEHDTSYQPHEYLKPSAWKFFFMTIRRLWR